MWRVSRSGLLLHNGSVDIILSYKETISTAAAAAGWPTFGRAQGYNKGDFMTAAAVAALEVKVTLI